MDAIVGQKSRSGPVIDSDVQSQHLTKIPLIVSLKSCKSLKEITEEAQI